MSDYFEPVPRPRIIAVGMTDAEIASLGPLAGTVTSVSRNSHYHPEEHDLLIGGEGEYHSYSSGIKRRLVFAAPPREIAGSVAASSSGSGGGYRSVTKARTQTRPARNLEVSSWATSERIASLVRASCVPEAGKPYVGLSEHLFPMRTMTPFLTESLSNPLTLCGLFEQEDEELGGLVDSVIWLPAQARSHLKEWLLFAIRRWRTFDSEAFPEKPEWASRAEWSVREELDAREALNAFDRAESDRLAGVEVERSRLVRHIESARKSGDDHRAMLTSTGAELVAEVAGAFRSLGFTIIDADDLPQHKGMKREDLRIIDSKWVALAEVKGYSGAAKSNDLLQVSGAVRPFMLAEKRAPDAVWYIVNAYRWVDPSQRPVALTERNADVSTFGEMHDGTVIDTRDLFRLCRSVEMGDLSQQQARDKLKNASPRFIVGASS
jgi:hypothetical protein